MQEYDFILEKVKEAGEMVMRLRAEKFDTTTKGGDPKDLVTSVDIAVSQFLVSEIKKAFPNDGIYSEEGGGVDTSQTRLWVIDPIDATANFSRSIPHFSVCWGLLENGVCIASAVYNPVTHELFSAKKGGGAFLNGKKISVSNITNLSEAHVLLHAGRKPEVRDWGGESYRRLLGAANKTINLACASLDVCFVAAGRVEANIYGVLWGSLDVAPALGILYEAGGVACDGEGNPIVYTPKPQRMYTANNQTMLDSVKNLLEA